ncbi:MAG: HRDC domain-containing protein [Myxococcota bacterium]
MDLPPLKYIDSHGALVAWVERLQHAEIIAIDTESDSFHSYKEKVCLIQMTALGEDAIIDPLALENLEPLRPLLADPSRIKVFHDAGYDLLCLGRSFNFEIRGLFDTMLASRLLGLKDFGLAAILQQRFGFSADKRLQRSDWARRPLTPQQIEYARFDTHFLPRLVKLLRAELKDVDRLNWALEDFSRLPDIAARTPAPSTAFDPDAWWRLRNLKSLSAVEKGRARELFYAREKLAEKLDRPPFKVFGDAVIIDLAADPPPGEEGLRPRSGLGPSAVKRFGPEIAEALKKAEPVKGNPPRGSGRRRRSGRFLDPLIKQRYEGLRILRKELAQELGVDPEVLLSNATLEDLSRNAPQETTQLRQYEQIDGWRLPLLGERIIGTLAAIPAEEPKPTTNDRRQKAAKSAVSQ